MPTEMIPQTVLSAVTYAQWVHCEQAHGARIGVQTDCPVCVALHHATQIAQHREEHAAPTDEFC